MKTMATSANGMTTETLEVLSRAARYYANGTSGKELHGKWVLNKNYKSFARRVISPLSFRDWSGRGHYEFDFFLMLFSGIVTGALASLFTVFPAVAIHSSLGWPVFFITMFYGGKIANDICLKNEIDGDQPNADTRLLFTVPEIRTYLSRMDAADGAEFDALADELPRLMRNLRDRYESELASAVEVRREAKKSYRGNAARLVDELTGPQDEVLR